MKKILFLLSFFFSAITYSQSSHKQATIYCDGLKKLSIKPFVALNGYVQKGNIKKSDLIRYDLQIGLIDTTYKIVGFSAGYDCHSGSLLDYNEKKYFGNRIKAGDAFITRSWVGDILLFDCINVEKAGQRFLVTGIYFDVIE